MAERTGDRGNVFCAARAVGVGCCVSRRTFAVFLLKSHFRGFLLGFRTFVHLHKFRQRSRGAHEGRQVVWFGLAHPTF
jgi:hypothetical protein